MFYFFESNNDIWYVSSQLCLNGRISIYDSSQEEKGNSQEEAYFIKEEDTSTELIFLRVLLIFLNVSLDSDFFLLSGK